MRYPTLFLFLPVLAVASTACMTDRQMQRLDAELEAGWRPSQSYCTFGGETAALAAYCARLNFGADGMEAVLRGENVKILQASAGHPLRCADHVAQAKARLGAYGDDYEMTDLYSCDRVAHVENGRRVCHVSLLVADKVTGARFVVDNGHVLNPGTTGGVAAYRHFAGLVEYAWTSEVPAGITLGAQ
jgi:hypothetical protein